MVHFYMMKQAVEIPSKDQSHPQPGLEGTWDSKRQGRLTVPWMDPVWLICTTTKSSYRFFAPGYRWGSDRDGVVSRH